MPDACWSAEFDHAVVEYAQGKPLSEIGNASYVKDGKVVHNPSRPLMQTAELDELPFATDVYQKDVAIEKYNVPFLLHPFVSFYTARGCRANLLPRRSAYTASEFPALRPRDTRFLMPAPHDNAKNE